MLRAGNRVVYGHPFETIDAEGKKAEVQRFYSREASDTERSALLQRYGVRYVLVGPQQTEVDLARSWLTPVWAGNEAILYRVGGEP